MRNKEGHGNRNQPPQIPTVRKQAVDTESKVGSVDDSSMERYFVSDSGKEAAQLFLAAATVPGDTEVVENRTKKGEEDDVGIYESVGDEEGPEGFGHPAVVFLVAAWVHQRLVEQTLGHEEGGEGPHGHFYQGILPESVQDVHAEAVPHQSRQNVKQCGQSDQRGVGTFPNSEGGFPIGVPM